MSRNRILSASLVLLTLFTNPVLLAHDEESHEEASQCTTPPVDLIIDANTGDETGPTEYPNNTAVEIALRYKNPYKYTYQWQIVSENIEQSVINDALRIFGISTEPDEDNEDAEAPAPAPSGIQNPAEDDDPCNQYPNALKVACQLELQVDDKRKDLDSQYKKEEIDLKNYNKAFTDFKKRIEKDITSEDQCRRVEAGTVQMLQALPALVNLKKLKDLKTEVGQLAQKIQFAEDTINSVDCSLLTDDAKIACEEAKGDGNDSLRDKVIDEKNLVAALNTKVTNLDAKYSKDETQKAYKELLALARAVDASPQPFVETRTRPQRRAPMKHSITIIRTKRQAKDGETPENLGPVEVTVGVSRFTLSAGVGFSFVNDPTFGRQNGRDAEGNVKPVFAITEESDTKIGGVVQLNACLSKCSKDWAFHWSLGMGVGIGDEDADFNFYTGPSFSFLDDQFFVTLAYHQRDVTELAEGFTVGEVIPEEINEGLPTTTKSDQGLLLTITYKFR